MSGGGREISNVKSLLAVGLDEKPLMVRRVPGGRDSTNPGHDLTVTLDEIDESRLDERNKVVREIARRGALVRMRGVLVLAALHHVPRVRESRANRAVRRAKGIAAGVVEVKV